MHYERWRITGTLEPGPRAHGSLEERFWRKVEKRGPDDCWLWTGNKTPKGYGRIQRGGKGSAYLSAHRLSHEWHKGKIPAGAVVMHSCDTPSCVNPRHLQAGGQSENIAEAFLKGRKTAVVSRGARNGKSVLTAEKVRFIRRHPELSHVELARRFGVTPKTIRSVRTGRCWSHVK